MKLEINNLIKEYGEIKALSNVSIELDNVSVLTLIGPSGGGKSTMLRVMGGLEIPDEGRVLINDEMVNYKIQEESSVRTRILIILSTTMAIINCCLRAD